MKTPTAYLFVLLIAGCAAQQQYSWERTGASAEDRSRDGGQCEAQAEALHPLAPETQKLRVYLACMRGRGWALVPR